MVLWRRGREQAAPGPEVLRPGKEGRKMSLAGETRQRSNPVIHPTHPGMVRIPGGSFMMGSDRHYAEEAPVHRVSVDGFWIDRNPVTNEDFDVFVQETGYVTVAERPVRAEDYPGAIPQLLAPGSIVFQKPHRFVDMRNHYNWWTYVMGADWRHPYGPKSSLSAKAQHPVVQITHEDATAYAQWAGKELPTEAEWEYAARGGLDGAEFAWGGEFMPKGYVMANTWQGEFPWQNLTCGGYEGTTPVGLFAPNGYGLFDIIGNVWEWTTDWYAPRHSAADCCGGGVCNPKGGERDASIDVSATNLPIPRKVMKGGSYLCAPNYCQRYRPAARMAQPIDSATCHLGFRCVARRDA
jgi:formylglycine-generating enzyme